MRIRTEKQFKGEHLHSLKNPPLAFLSNPYACKLEAFDYIPEGPKFIPKDGSLYMNIYRSNQLIPSEGDCSVLLEHFDYIFQDEAIREHWLNYFASIVQFPDKKIKHCLLLIGKRQGTGKSFFKTLLERLVGAWNVTLMESGSWMASFNSHLLNKQISVIEELAVRKEQSAYNALKEYITEEFITAKEKHVTAYSARTPFAMLAISNDPKPIVIEAGDRRFHVCETLVEPREKEYYNRLFKFTNAELAAFKYYLLQRDLSNFSPDEPPPDTDDKRRLGEQSYSPAKAALDLAIQLRMPPFHRDIMTLHEVQNYLRGQAGINERQLEFRNLRETLKDLDALSLRQQSIDGKRYSLWAIRNAEKWKNTTANSVKEEFSKK